MITCIQAKNQLAKIQVLKPSFDQAFSKYKETRDHEPVLGVQKQLDRAITNLSEIIQWSDGQLKQIIKDLIYWAEGEIGYTSLVARELIDSFRIDKKAKTISTNGDIVAVFKSTLKKVPAHMVISGSAIFSGCMELIEIEEGFKVKHRLDLIDCTSLQKLPDDLIVVDAALLTGCSSLEQLPKNMKIGRDLNLSGCMKLYKLPDDLIVGGDIFVDDQLLAEAQRLKKFGRIKGKINP